MNVNQTRFHHLLGANDWRPAICAANGLLDDPVLDWQGQTVTLKPLVFRFPQRGQAAERLTPDQRRGAACDRYGNWYWIGDDERSLRFLSAGAQSAVHYWASNDEVKESTDVAGEFRPQPPPTPPPLLQLRGLTVTQHHYLVVGVVEPAGLLIFDLHAGGRPIALRWPVPFAPFDMAAATDDGVWILDRPADETQACRLWRLDRDFCVVAHDDVIELAAETTDDFQPKPPLDIPRGTAAQSFSTGIRLEMGSPLEGIRPIAVETLPDNSVLLLENSADFSTLYRTRGGQLIGEPFSFEDLLEDLLDEAVKSADPAAAHLHAHDIAFNGDLFAVATDGNQAFRLTATLTDDDQQFELTQNYFPLRRYSGKALVAHADKVYYDLGERWLPLVKQPRCRYRPLATLQLPIDFDEEELSLDDCEPKDGWRHLLEKNAAFDGREPDCVWHRLLIDALIPPETAISVQSRASNRREALPLLEWQDEPPLYRRRQGSELAYHDSGVESWELLLQAAQGRYLQLRLTLRGNQRRTPRLRALRVYYPRFSYLIRYLPAAYRYDVDSADFLDRFLANFEGQYTDIEERIAQVQALFNVNALDAEYLPWLASWIGVTLDPAWDVARRRLFMRHALTIFRQRGTLQGLIRTVRLAIDDCPDDTLFTTDPDNASVRIQEQGAHRFAVSVAAVGDSVATRQRLDLVSRIVAIAKPAHTNFEVKSFLALFQIGSARLGYDTLLGQGSRFTALMLGDAFLAESYLGAAHPFDVADRFVVGRDTAAGDQPDV